MSSFITVDATQDVFELVLARPVMTPAGEHPWLVHLWWRSPSLSSQVVQVYVQDELYDVSLDSTSREMFLVLDRTRANRIELLAVLADDPDAIWRAQPERLGSWRPRVRDVAAASIVRDEALPIDTRVDVELDGAVLDSALMWPNDVNRSDPDGELLTGEVSGLGMGVGSLGAGRLGYGGEHLPWRRDDLKSGTHDISIHAMGDAGRPVADSISLSGVQIDGLPDPVQGLTLDQSFGVSWDS